jgi:hypothetical protein
MVRLKIVWACLLILFCLEPALNAQLEQQIDQLIEEESASFGRVVYVVLSSLTLCNETDSIEEAIAALNDKNWGIKTKSENEQITLGEYSFLLMKAFNLNGGLMYTLFPGPRYAVRELAYNKLIPGNADPDRSMTGEEVMTIFTRLANSGEGSK